MSTDHNGEHVTDITSDNANCDTNLDTNSGKDTNADNRKDITQDKNADTAMNNTVENHQMNLEDEPFEIKSVHTSSNDKGATLETSAIIDHVISDKDKIIPIVGLLLFIVGSYFNFWSLYRTDLGIMNQGNLFGGYMCAGLFGKLCVILAVASIVLIFLNLLVYNWYVVLGISTMFVFQVILILIFGRDELGEVSCSVMPGAGFFICLICIGVNLIFSRKLYKKGK